MLTEELILELESEGGATKDRVVISEMVVPDVGRDLEEVLRVIDLGTTDPNLERQFLSSLSSPWARIPDPTVTSRIDPTLVILSVVPILGEGHQLIIKLSEEITSELDPLSTTAGELGLLHVAPAVATLGG